LRIGGQGLLGYDTVLYYTVGCFACGRPSTPNLYRVYTTPDGRERTDDLFAPLAKYGGYAHSFAADWGPGVLWVALCTSGYCGGEGEPSADASETVFRSEDSGVSWEPLGKLTTGTFLVGPLDGEVLSVTYLPAVVYQLLPSGRPVLPPVSGESEAVSVPGQGTVWQGREPDGSPLLTFSDARGVRLFRAPARYARYVEKTPQGNLVEWHVGPNENETRIGLLDDSGRVLRSWSWAAGGGSGAGNGYNFLQVSGQFAENRLYGTVLTPMWFEFGTDSPGITEDALRHDRMFSIEIAVINLDTGTIHPLWGPSFDLSANQNPFAVHIDTGPVRRVTTGADCLNVREKPAKAAPGLGCFKEGVLLRLRAEPEQSAEGVTWVAVETPDGHRGWASGEFLER
jgi:hypothetical protein